MCPRPWGPRVARRPGLSEIATLLRFLQVDTAADVLKFRAKDQGFVPLYWWELPVTLKNSDDDSSQPEQLSQPNTADEQRRHYARIFRALHATISGRMPVWRLVQQVVRNGWTRSGEFSAKYAAVLMHAVHDYTPDPPRGTKMLDGEMLLMHKTSFAYGFEIAIMALAWEPWRAGLCQKCRKRFVVRYMSSKKEECPRCLKESRREYKAAKEKARRYKNKSLNCPVLPQTR